MSIAQPGGIAPAALSRHTVAQLASGGSLLLAGALFATPFLLNTRAQENDVFFTNLFLAPLISLLGSLLYLFALRRLGLSILPLLALLIINLAALTGWLWIPISTPQRFALIAALLAADAVLLVIVGALVAGMRRQWGAWALATLLALLASAALAVIYLFFGGQYLAFGETASSLPPYLNITALLAAVGLAIVVYMFGWFGSRVR
jgi:hypothetical protein